MNAPASLELRKFVAPEFIYGAGAIGFVGRYAKNFGARHALVVSDPGVIAAGWTQKALASLAAEDLAAAVFDGVTPNPKDHEVAEGVRFYREKRCDIIVAVGGGSPMDCAKAIAISSANEGSILSYEGVDMVPVPGPPLICVPTTAGSAADVSQFAIITDTARKLKIAIVTKMVVPDVALIDPETTTTMPAELTAATGLDALVHAIEAYVSNASSVFTDLNALAAIPRLSRHLVAAIENPLALEHRNEMMLGSLQAGLAFSNASLGLVHAMAHSLGGLLGFPHGLCNALLMERVVAFNYSACPERYDDVARAMGLALTGQSEKARKEALLKALAALRDSVGIHATIGSLGATGRDIRPLALNAANDACLATNPRKATTQDIERLYEEAL